jgi:hypothetical protein
MAPHRSESLKTVGQTATLAEPSSDSYHMLPRTKGPVHLPTVMHHGRYLMADGLALDPFIKQCNIQSQASASSTSFLVIAVIV